MTIQQPIPMSAETTPATEATAVETRAIEVSARVTPMMEQYLEIKSANPGLLLFYRMGDFYELFFEDAEIASKALGIMLTKRGKHQGMDIPMCGVPVERSEDYLHRLINAGHRVAVCEQTADPAATIGRLIEERHPVYELADITVASRDVLHEKIVEECMAALHAHLCGANETTSESVGATR